MIPVDNSVEELSVYADWLLDEGRDAESERVRQSISKFTPIGETARCEYQQRDALRLRVGHFDDVVGGYSHYLSRCVGGAPSSWFRGNVGGGSSFLCFTGGYIAHGSPYHKVGG